VVRYYFHFRHGDSLETDDVGTDLPHLSAAVREAELAAREVLADAIKGRRPTVPEAVVITDDSGVELYSLPFAAVLPDPLNRLK
jgi:hypothetical protein